MPDVEKNRFTSIPVRLDTFRILCSMKGDETHDCFLRRLLGAYQYRKGHTAPKEMKDAERARLFMRFSTRARSREAGAKVVRTRRKQKRTPAAERAPSVGKQKVSSEEKKDTSSDEGLRRKFDDVKYLIE